MKLPEDFPGGANLTAAGYTTINKVQSATDDELLAVEGIGPATLQKIREYQVDTQPESDGSSQCSYCSHYFDSPAAVKAHVKEEHE